MTPIGWKWNACLISKLRLSIFKGRIFRGVCRAQTNYILDFFENKITLNLTKHSNEVFFKVDLKWMRVWSSGETIEFCEYVPLKVSGLKITKYKLFIKKKWTQNFKNINHSIHLENDKDGRKLCKIFNYKRKKYTWTVSKIK